MFKTGIVLHYVKEYSSEEVNNLFNHIKESQKEKTLKPNITNKGLALKNFLKQLPIGTIICKNLTDRDEKTVICLPLFSSHMSLPVKPGEEIWYFEDSESDFNEKDIVGKPLLSLKNYWISRKIGTKIAEDLNFTHIQRNALISDVRSDDNLNDGEIRIPNNENTQTYEEKYDEVIPDIEEIYSKSKNEKNIFPSAVPRWNSKPYELTLQGSNNSLINLTKNFNRTDNTLFEGKGAIDLVAGRHTLQDYTTFAGKDFNLVNYDITDIKDYNTSKNLHNTNIKPIYLDDNFLKINNVYGDDECLKDPEYYLNKENASKVKEGEIELEKDASRIYLSEFDNVDHEKYYDTRFVTEQKITTFNSQENVFNTPTIKTYKNSSADTNKKDSKENKNNNQMFKINFNNLKTKKLSLNDDLILPTIFLKTNNLRIVARKETENNFESKILDEGSIRIIKESEDYNSYSHLLMEKDGNVLFDGKSIYIGNFKRELLNKNIINNINQNFSLNNLDAAKQANIENMKGNGDRVLIGYDPQFSEPLVLGESLKAIITELINLNISLANELEAIAIALETHVHLGIPNSGISKGPKNTTPYSDYHSKSHKNLKSKYEEVRDNLKDMLSKFAKTS